MASCGEQCDLRQRYSTTVCYAEKQQVVYGHRNFEFTLPNDIRASFIWAPYAANLTSMYSNW